MKKIEAIVRPQMVDTILAAIGTVGYSGIMITEIQGHGKQKGIVQQWRGEQYKIAFIPKTKFEIVCADKDVPKLMKAIADAAKTGEVGDGKIFVYTIDQAMRIRSGETGEIAL
jgi:nitrogen regulatory protein P-II 1